MPFPQQDFLYQGHPVTQEPMQQNRRVVHPTVFANAREMEMMRGGPLIGYQQQRAHAGGISYHVAGGAVERDMPAFMPSVNMFQNMGGANVHASLTDVDKGIHGGSGFGSPFLNKLPKSSPTNAGPLDPTATVRGVPQAFMSSFSRAPGIVSLPPQSASLYPQHLQHPIRSQQHDDYGVDPDEQL